MTEVEKINSNSSQRKTKATRKPSNRTTKQVALAEVSDFVTSTTSNVYGIAGLPEEFIATLFAKVSRSPLSFRTHLEKVIQEFSLVKPIHNQFKELDEKAKAFHEKWTVGYGHSSVAEHAILHLAVENISRIATAELELSSQFLSITEYSQRYQKPKLGDWTNPFKESDEEYALFDEYMVKMYEYFDRLNEILYTEQKEAYFKSDEGRKLMDEDNDAADKKIRAKLSQFEKIAFEDARYLLPLAMHSQLGLTANARALKDVIVGMKLSNHAEVNATAIKIQDEASKIVPVLLKHTEPTQFQKNAKKRQFAMFSDLNVKTNKEGSSVSIVQSSNAEMIKTLIVAILAMEEKNISLEEALYLSKSQKPEEVDLSIKLMNHELDAFDNPIEAFKQVNFSVLMYISEANWHQLLRHNRGADFSYGKPSNDFGFIVPPAVRSSMKATHVFNDAIAYSNEMLAVFDEKSSTAAEYGVLNAHIRPVLMNASLYELYHLINLRTSSEAQWEIRDTFNELFNMLASSHNILIEAAPRRK